MANEWLPLNQYKVGETLSRGKPMYLHTKPVLINSYSDLIEAVAEWLIEQGHLSESDCPISTPRAQYRYLVNTNPSHSNGSPMKPCRQLSNGLYLLVGHNDIYNLQRSKYLLKRFGEDPARLGLSSVL